MDELGFAPLRDVGRLRGKTSFGKIAKSIVIGTCVLTIAVLVVRTSEILGQESPIKIGPDQSKASMAETLSWLKQRAPDLGTFTYESYKTTIRFDEDCKCEAMTISKTEVVQTEIVLKWNLVDCEVQYEQQGPYRIEVPIRDLDPVSFQVIPTIKSPMFPRPPWWTLEMYTKGNHDYLGDSAKYRPIHVTGFGARSAETRSGSASIKFPDQESAERVGRALKHAAILCGATVDPF